MIAITIIQLISCLVIIAIVLLQSGNSGFHQKIVHLQLKGSAQNGQRQQQDGGRSKEAAAER